MKSDGLIGRLQKKHFAVDVASLPLYTTSY